MGWETGIDRLDAAAGSVRRFRSLTLATLAVVLLGGGAGYGKLSPSGAADAALAQEAATPVADGAALATPVTSAADPCPDELTGEGSEPWIRAELYFGTTSPDGTLYPEEEWLDFLDSEITPRFPAGLTVLTGLGQFQGEEDEDILRERSQVLIILFPAETAAESSVLLEEIRDAYEEQFQQQSVLRADTAPVCTSF